MKLIKFHSPSSFDFGENNFFLVKFWCFLILIPPNIEGEENLFNDGFLQSSYDSMDQ